jgi:hypothetical protein
MTSPFHKIVRLFSIKNEQSNRTWNISGTVSKADEGKALALDTTAQNTVKLAGDGDTIIGRMEIYEDRGVCTMQHHFTEKLPKDAATVIAIGDTVVGAGGGLVKAGATKAAALNYVCEVQDKFVVVIRM